MNAGILVPHDGSAVAEIALPHAVALARWTRSRVYVLRVGRSCEAVRGPVAHSASSPPDAADADGVVVECASGQDVVASVVVRSRQQPPISLIVVAGLPADDLYAACDDVVMTLLEATTVPLLLVRGDPAIAPRRPIAYTSIMVPLDGSMFADQALVFARALAAHARAKLVLVTVVPPAARGESGADAEAIGRERAAWCDAAYLEQKAAQLREEGLCVCVEQARGDPATEILRRADAERADLVVMATHGLGGSRAPRLGSVAARVIRQAAVPVLLIREWQAQRHRSLGEAAGVWRDDRPDA